MTDTRKTQLAFEVDASGARAGFRDVEQGAKTMAQSVAQAGQQAARGMDGIATGGDKAAQGVDKATKSIISSVQRATAAIEAGEKGSARYFETLASQRGANVSALKPYLEQLEEARRRADAAAGSVGQMGISAKQTAAALRGVPAQFTDIATSLASGQAPLTVLLQQGGQLKDMFGGVGAAARALGGYVVGLVNPFTVAAAAAGVLSYALYQAEEESSALNKQLVLSGNVAGVTAGQLTAMAKAIDGVVGTQGKAAEVLAGLAGTGKVASDQLQGAAAAIISLNRSAGVSVEELTKDFAELGKAPADGIAKLNEKYNFLTAATYAQIKALEDQGRVEDAAALAQKTYSNMLSDRAESVRRSLGTLEKGWMSVKDVAKEAWDAMLGIGREDSLGDQIADLEARRDRFASMGGQTYGRSRQDVISDYNLQIGRLRTEELQSQAAARSQAARQRQENERIAAQKKWSEDSERFLSREAKLRADIQRIREQGTKAGASEAEIQQRIAFVTEQLNAKSAQSQRRAETAAETARKNAQNDLQALQVRQQAAELDLQLMRERGVTTSQLNEGERKALEIQQELKAITDERTRSIKQQELASANALAQTLKDRDALVELLRAQKEFEGARDREAKASESAIAQVEARAQAMADEVAAFGLGKDAIEALTIARLEERKAVLAGFAGSEEEISRIEREIAARKELAKQIASKDVLESNAKAAKEAQQEWQRATQEIERSITDSLMRGFESGKGFAETLRDTVVNMFKTMVLRPVVQAVVQPIAGGLLGTGSASALAGQVGQVGQSGAGGLGDLVGLVRNLTSNSMLFENFGLGVTNSIYEIGGSLTSAGFGGLGSSVTEFASSVAGFSDAISVAGDVFGYGSALYSLSEGKYGAAAGAAIGTFFGGPLGGAIGGYIGGMLDGGGYQPVGTGGYYSSRGLEANRGNALMVTNGYGNAADDLIKRGNSQTRDWLAKTVEGVLAESQVLGAMVGRQAKFGIDAGFAFAGDEAAYYGYADVTMDGRQIKDYVNRGLGGDAQQAAATFVKDLQNSVAEGLLSGSGLQRSGEAAADTLKALASSLSTVNGIFRAMDKALLSVSLSSAGASRDLLERFGGNDKAAASLGAYFEAFYSQAERSSISAKLLAEQFAAMNLSMPGTRDGLRSLIDGVDLSTESGRKLYVALVNMAPAFDGLLDSVEATTGGIKQEIERIRALESGNSAMGLAQLEASFAIKTAQARAGDQSAIDALPQLSQALLTAADAMASSALDVAATRAATLASLEATLSIIGDPRRLSGLPAFAGGGDFAGGWRIVGERGPELEATGAARIFNAQDTARIFSPQGGNEAVLRELVAELKALRDDQRKQSAAQLAYAGRTAQILQAVSQDGTALNVTTAT